MGCGATELLPTRVSALNFSGHTRCHHIPASSCLSQSIGEFTELTHNRSSIYSPFPPLSPLIALVSGVWTVFNECAEHEDDEDPVISQMARRHSTYHMEISARLDD